MLNIPFLDHQRWFSLNKEQGDTVKRIAADFPYSIELISGIFIEHKYSEEKTREILMFRSKCGLK